MGFGDNEPPALRADPFPATLAAPGGFHMLALTFVSWDVLKLSASVNGHVERSWQIDATGKSTDFDYAPARSGAGYAFVAQGCSRTLGGGTGHCSPTSSPLERTAAVNTNSMRAFLRRSGVNTSAKVSVRGVARGRPLSSLRALMGV
jgi:hypothetical protein